jgi:cyclic beta-1,2-glucan synthetase
MITGCPDHFQESLAMWRTIPPTNIGMHCSRFSTRSGYIDLLELEVRLRSTFENMGKLEHYRGHLLNWYDTQTLAALAPRYISTVDSGNLAACLITLNQGLLALTEAPFLGKQQWQGLLVILDILKKLIASTWARTKKSESRFNSRAVRY